MLSAQPSSRLARLARLTRLTRLTRRALAALAALALLVGAPLSRASAEPFSPADLEAWRSWVRRDIKDLGCAQREGEARCVWPTLLELTLPILLGRIHNCTCLQQQ